MFEEESQGLSNNMLRLVTFANELLGAHCKLREIHWNTYNQSTHDLSDNLMYKIMSTVDSLFESMMGIEERPGYGVIYPKIPNSTSVKEILQALISKINSLEMQLSSPVYSGVTQILKDFKKSLNKSIYLTTLS
jgi:hypothetical protein